MKISKTIVLAISLIALLAVIASSQIPEQDNPQNLNKISRVLQETDKLTLAEEQECNTAYEDEVQPIYGNCINYFNYTNCLNTSGPNTDCVLNFISFNVTCKTGETIVKRDITECKPLNKFIISINKELITEKKEIDFSNWGPCIQSIENNCLIVTCVSKYDGAHKGQFTDCRGGKSCQKFRICDNEIKVFYKNSGEDFAEYDPTFLLDKLEMKEVSE